MTGSVKWDRRPLGVGVFRALLESVTRAAVAISSVMVVTRRR
jgi:hypothetical protein